MKILVIAPTPFFADRGCHTRIYEEAKALIRLGHEIKIVTYHLGNNKHELDIHRIINIPWYHKLSAGPSWHKIYLDILLFFKACRVNQKFKADIIHGHLHEGALIGVCLRYFLKKPVLFDYQGSLTNEIVSHGFTNKESLVFKLFKSIELFIDRQVDFIIVSAGFMKQAIVDNFLISKDKIQVVEDGVDTTLYQNINGQYLIEKLKLPKKKLIVYTGYLSEYQGIDLLIEAAKLLSTKRDDFHFLIVGYPEENYQNLVKVANLSSRFTFTGKVDYRYINDYLSVADIGISPKISETEGNLKLYSYMACKLPAIVFDKSVNRDILGEFGFYAKEQTAISLADKVSEVLDYDVIYLQNIGQSLFDRVSGLYHWDKLILKIDSFYNFLKDKK